MVAVIYHQIRYDQPDENGLTRRDRNENFGYETPDIFIPDHGAYLLNWFWEISNGVPRVKEGVCYPIPWSEYSGWVSVTNNIVRPSEYDTLRAMDAAFCEETNKELKDFRERQSDKARQGST